MKTQREVQALLRRHIDETCGGSQREFALKIGISEAYLSEILRGTRRPGALVLQELGLRRSEVYEQEQEQPDGMD